MTELSADDTPTISVGMSFSDYDSFQKTLDAYSLANNYVYTIKSSRSIDLVNKKLTPNKKPFSKKLRKSQITLACKHHGTFRRKSNGIRPNQRSYKTGCPSLMTVAVSTKSRQLVIKRFIEEHNHEVDADLAQCYPERRRLTMEEKRLLHEQLLDENIKPTDLKEYVRSTTNKAITCKDIYNFRSRYRELESRGKLVQQDANKSEDVSEPSSPQAKVECEDWMGEAEYLEEEINPYNAVDVGMDEEVWEVGEAEEEVEVESEDASAQRQMEEEVERVNEAWRCVYAVLEGENRRLRTEMAKMADEMNALKRRRVICHGCSKAITVQKSPVQGRKPQQIVISPRKPVQSGMIFVRAKPITIQTDREAVGADRDTLGSI